MALQIDVTLDSGINISAAYARIQEIITMHTNQDQHQLMVLIYATNQAYVDGKPPVQVLNFVKEYDDTATVSFADVYTYLKTLPEFANAIDV